MMVLYGGSSGAGAAVRPDPALDQRSLFVTRPTLKDYTATREELELRAGDVLRWVADGSLKLRLEHNYPLAEAAQAHRDLEGAQDHRQGAADSVGVGGLGSVSSLRPTHRGSAAMDGAPEHSLVIHFSRV